MGYYQVVSKRKYYDPVSGRSMRDHDEYIPRRRNNNGTPTGPPPFNQPPVPPDTRDTNPECNIFRQPFTIDMYEEHYVSAIVDYTQTRAGAKPNQDFSLLEDPNIGGLLESLNVTYDPGLGYSIGGVQVTFEEVIELAQLTLDKRRDLGGQVLAVGFPKEVLYAEFAKETDPTRDGPVWTSDEVDVTSWQNVTVPISQDAQQNITVIAVAAEAQITGIEEGLTLPTPVVKATGTTWQILLPPWPTAFQSYFVEITVYAQETDHPECKRAVKFRHWVDYVPPAPTVRLAFYDGPLSNVEWGRSWQTEIPLIGGDAFCKENSIAALAANPQASMPKVFLPRFTLDSQNNQVYTIYAAVKIAQQLNNVPAIANDWVFLHGKDDTEYKGTELARTSPNDPGTNLRWDEGTWVKFADSQVLPDNGIAAPVQNCISENFSEKNPRSFPEQERNLSQIKSQDYLGSISSSLSRTYKNSSKWPASSYLHPWTPIGDQTKANDLVPLTHSRLWRNVLPVSSTEPNGNRCDWYFFQKPQYRWGPTYFQLESKFLRLRSTLAVEYIPQAVGTTRSGLKIAETGQDGTSYHETTTPNVSINFDWEFENTEDATVFVPFGYEAESVAPFTYDVTAGTNFYTLETALSVPGVYRGAVDIRHSEGKAGYRHFFEITYNGVELVPYTFTSYQFIPLLAQHALGNTIDEYYQTFTLSLNQGWNFWHTWHGGRTEEVQSFELFYFNAPYSALPTIVLQNNPSLRTGSFTVSCNGFTYTTDIVDVGGVDTINFKTSAYTDAAIKLAWPQGLIRLTLSLTSQPRRALTGTAELDPLFYNFTQYKAEFPAGATIQNRTAYQVFTGHDTLTNTDPSLFQVGVVPSQPDGTALCPNNSFYTCTFSVGPNAQIESLVIYFQASLGLQLNTFSDGTRGAEKEVRAKGCDINAAPYCALKVPRSCITLQAGGTWRVRYGRIPASAARVAGFSWWEIPQT